VCQSKLYTLWFPANEVAIHSLSRQHFLAKFLAKEEQLKLLKFLFKRNLRVKNKWKISWNNSGKIDSPCQGSKIITLSYTKNLWVFKTFRELLTYPKGESLGKTLKSSRNGSHRDNVNKTWRRKESPI